MSKMIGFFLQYYRNRLNQIFREEGIPAEATVENPRTNVRKTISETPLDFGHYSVRVYPTPFDEVDYKGFLPFYMSLHIEDGIIENLELLRCYAMYPYAEFARKITKELQNTRLSTDKKEAQYINELLNILDSQFAIVKDCPLPQKDVSSEVEGIKNMFMRHLAESYRRRTKR